MATQAYPYLAISDGTTTVTICDGLGGVTNYPLVRGSWSPAVARYRPSRMGGRGSYSDVTEQIEINIRGATAAAAFANLDTLTNLLDQAGRWWRGEDVNPVLIKYAPQGSTINSTAAPLQALVLGRAPGDETGLPATLNDAGLIQEIRGVRVRLLRRGQWISATNSGSSAAVNCAATSNALYGSGDHLMSSPVKLSLAISGVNPNTVQQISEAVLLLAHTSSGIAIAEMEALTAAGFTSFADAANKARNGSVLRYTPTGTAFAATATTTSDVSTTTMRIGIYLAVRSSSTAVTWTIRAVGTYAGTLSAVRTPDYTFIPTDTNPTILFLGYLVSDGGFSTVGFEVKASTISGAPTLDMDYRVYLIGSSEYVRAITLDPIGVGGAVSSTLTIDPAPLTEQQPSVSYKPGATAGPVTYRGDAYTTIASAGAGLIASTYFTLLATYNNYWRLVDTAANLVTVTLTGTRYTAVITPQ